jgi:hypothetical protein
VEYSYQAAPYTSGITGAWVAMTVSSLSSTSCCSAVLDVAVYCSSSACTWGLSYRPKSPPAGRPTGADRVSSIQKS